MSLIDNHYIMSQMEIETGYNAVGIYAWVGVWSYRDSGEDYRMSWFRGWSPNYQDRKPIAARIYGFTFTIPKILSIVLNSRWLYLNSHEGTMELWEDGRICEMQVGLPPLLTERIYAQVRIGKWGIVC